MAGFDDYEREQAQRRERLAERLESAQVQLLAVHPASITPEQLRFNIEAEPDFTSLSWDYLLELFENLCVFDLRISDIGVVPVLLESITQDNDEDQAPYLETYFDDSGSTLLFPEQAYMPTPPESATHPCRLRFYLHYVDLNAPLVIGDEYLDLPDPTPLPEWLKAAMPYRPPN